MARKTTDWISGYLDLTQNTEPPNSYKEWIAVSVIASALQRKCFASWGDIIFYPNMYIVLVGPSGKCRKGTAMSTGATFLRKLGVHMAAEAITREALIRELAEATTDSMIGQKVVKHSSLTIFSPELTVFLGYGNLQLISDLTDWYDCRDFWIYRTKGSGTDEIVGVWVNLIGATTPSLIREALPPDAIGGGLTSRIIFVYEDEKSKPVPFPFHDKDTHRDLEQALVHDLAEINQMSGQFFFDKSFFAEWGDWYLKQDANPPIRDPNFEGYVSRRPNHVMKLCMIVSASERDDKIINGRIFHRALDMLRRAEKKMPQVFSGYGANPHGEVMKRMMMHIAHVKNTTEEELWKVFWADIQDRKQLHAMFESFKMMGFATIKPVPNHKGHEITFNPKFKAP